AAGSAGAGAAPAGRRKPPPLAWPSRGGCDGCREREATKSADARWRQGRRRALRDGPDRGGSGGTRLAGGGRGDVLPGRLATRHTATAIGRNTGGVRRTPLPP